MPSVLSMLPSRRIPIVYHKFLPAGNVTGQINKFRRKEQTNALMIFEIFTLKLQSNLAQYTRLFPFKDDLINRLHTSGIINSSNDRYMFAYRKYN